MANAPQPTTVKKESSSSASNAFALLVIPICIILGFSVWYFVFGASNNFIDGDRDKLPLPGNYLGTAFKGGFVVAILVGLLLTTIVFSIERLIVIGKASGTINLEIFIRKVQGFLSAGNIEAAKAECDKQKGSVANVIKSGLKKYSEVENNPKLDVEQSIVAIQKEVEEATALEMPMLEKNLTIIATLVSIGTLIGLLGTVKGMITAFAGLANSGAPDQSALAVGISEALINTMTGISVSTVAIIMYNVLTSKIDSLTYAIDEAGFSIVQTYASSHK
ncbi:MotA/TolQ/ExbB proton channel family protein [Pedobacter changchengzhani]|uniref:MotA/TolQ/ExbB proton channel family protein n=1 Tax=Pedobacter changchengzhani TaxID=2529274 RepID=A0A4V3A0D9_9SPHI|nr:MotA/TolQ/ExbB proton channel family protein [Pedobacter changchengzhani]TDG37263.1 MotA/TolQ/ExbB proton channel family protein [Pedobacter changchengzhani]